MKYQQTLSLGVNPGETFDQIDQTWKKETIKIKEEWRQFNTTWT